LFPIRKLTFSRKVNNISELCAGVLVYVEHTILQIYAEISQKGHFRMETRLIRMKSEMSTGVKKKRGEMPAVALGKAKCRRMEISADGCESSGSEGRE